jgi:hypothetical protein
MRFPQSIARKMREETKTYVLAVLLAHPELAPFDEEPDPDPYPLPRALLPDGEPDSPLLPIIGMRRAAYSVSVETGYTLKELRGSSRSSPLVRARWECFARCRAEGYSMPAIGKFFNRDHTTVLHGLRMLGCAPEARK